MKPIKISISPYTLEYKAFPQWKLKGTLLALDFKSLGRGYSDFLPWPGFGEKPLSVQLQDIKKGIFSQRFLISRHNAFLDAKARAERKNLFFGLRIPDSHFLISDLSLFKERDWVLLKDFSFVKVKLKPSQIKEQVKRIHFFSQKFKNLKWRLDLNGQDWSLWKSHLGFLKSKIDFVEDPLWTKISKEKKALFAQDWSSSSYSQIKIVKPSRDFIEKLTSHKNFSLWKRIVFTHSLDHPLGQNISAFWAGTFYKRFPRFFETGALKGPLPLSLKAYTKQISLGKTFSAPGGFGFGFSKALEEENWEPWS